jgi:CxxC motif-containing protein (DUF1111 family)
MRRGWSIGAVGLGLLLSACGDDGAARVAEDEALSGGEGTVFDTTRNAYALSLRNLAGERKPDFFVGNSFFNDNWVTAPASTTTRDGLGPLFNARSCSACHFKDGRGQPTNEDGSVSVGLLFRLSAPNGSPEPHYGGQLQPQGIQGVPPEATPVVRYEEVRGRFKDGGEYTLLKPVYSFEGLAYGPMVEGVLVSPRVAPGVYGLGLLEAIPESALLALEDEEDEDGDGISGRANYVTDVETGRPVLGRFGWKANMPNLRQQTAGAFAGDLGVTSPLFPGPTCEPGQAACLEAKDGGDGDGFELDGGRLDKVTFYMQTLAVPARRGVKDPAVVRGKELFGKAGCMGCHVARWVTGAAAIPELEGQVIYPYTDLLLHDMGPELADGRPDGLASGQEWRTPPLWGLGLLKVVNRHTRLLHDGRARDVQEAILWHGGEAERSREAYKAMSAAQRADLLRFMESL